MTSTLRANCRLAIAVYLLLCVHRSIAFKFYSSGDNDISTTSDKPQDSADLTALVRPIPDDQSGIYSHALQLLSAMQGSPSCNRVAASTLLDSCHSIDGSRQDAEISFDDARSIYAAQLAMCEIVSAESSMPDSCRSLVPVFDSKAHKPLSQKSIRKGQLSQCLQILESRPQWWTSYSNSRQNAVVMCQAARVDIEKDELIKLHRSMVDTNAEANSALARATSQANAALLQLHDQFALAKNAFQEQLMQDLDASTAKAHSFIDRLVRSMDAAVQIAMSNLASLTTEVEADTARLSENVRKANVDSVDLQRNVGKVFQQVAEGSGELAAFQSQHADRSREMAKELQGSLQNMRDQEINAMLSLFHGIHGQLQSSNDLVSSLHTRQNALDQRLISLDNSFASFESKAESFQAAQTRQAELQARLHNEMQIDMYVTRGLLDNITSSATNLHTTIQTSSALVGQVASLIGNLRGATRWIPTVLCVSVLFFVLCIFNLGFALRAAGLIVSTIILKAYGVFDALLLITSAQDAFSAVLPFDTHLLPLLAAASVLAVILAIAALCHFTNIIDLLRPHQLDIASDRPKLDMEKPKHAHFAYGV